MLGSQLSPTPLDDAKIARANTAPPWHALTADEVVHRLDTDSESGIDDRESEQRQRTHGRNRVEAAAVVRWYHVLGRQFVDVLVLILAVAAAISVVAGEISDALAILAIVLLNGLLGFVQEWKAERALSALKQMLRPSCQVVRNGEERVIDTVELVPGDLVILEGGDNVPADIRLVRTWHLELDESALTGESLTVTKEPAQVALDAPLAVRSSMAWMGTSVTNGRGQGIVVATGAQTEFGRIADLTRDVGRDPTPLQRKLAGLGRQLGMLAAVVALLVLLAGWLTGRDLFEMFLTGVSLAVAVVPEGLPAVVTLTMALGIRAMVRRRALLRRLQAAETLGAATVICTDKTGTLTENQMTVQPIWLPAGAVELTGVGYNPAGHCEQQGTRLDCHQRPDLCQLLESGLLCNHARLVQDEQGWHKSGSPTEAALVVAAYKAELPIPDDVATIAEYPFDSQRKRMSVVVENEKGRIVHIKGAPEVILERCSTIQVGETLRPLTDEDRSMVMSAFEKMATTGLRTLAIARREISPTEIVDATEVETQLTLLGIVGLLDPPRPEVPEAIRLAKSAGIRIVLITGDAAPTAQAIARRIGLPFQRCLTGRDIDLLSDEQLSEALAADAVLARATPEQKLRIVTNLQSRGQIVGMTGDGVNDAPALKKADIGIAMGVRGTDVARGAADMVLMDDNFSSIVGAIEEGRRQYDNIQKFVRYLLSSNIGEVLAILLNILMGGPLILLPIQILWINLITDGVTAVALGVEPCERGVMQRPPHNPRRPLLDRRGLLMVGGLGCYVGLATLALYHIYLGSSDPQTAALAGTVAFTGIILVEKVNVLNFRSLQAPLRWSDFFSNPWILVAILSMIGLQMVAIYTPMLQRILHTVPLRAADWMFLAAVALPIFFLTESYKRWHAHLVRTKSGTPSHH